MDKRREYVRLFGFTYKRRQQLKHNINQSQKRVYFEQTENVIMPEQM